MELSAGSTPSTDSSKKSALSGYIPGTPKPPIDPPRRRSSLYFSRVLQQKQSPKTPDANSTNSNEGLLSKDRTNSSNASRKNIPSPLTMSIAMPGHVAQMQKLFQTAKASLRLDVRFAASPVGSIDSRLPESPGNASNSVQSVATSSPKSSTRAASTPSKDWRYSTAPRVLAEVETDVREPFPEGSPRLPDYMSINVDQSKVLVAEPLSSGFTSPIGDTHQDSEMNEYKSSPLSVDTKAFSTDTDDSIELPLLDEAQQEGVTTDDLHQPLTELRVTSGIEMDLESASDSPVTSHLERRSRDAGKPHSWLPVGGDDLITLSETAKAAAASARVKRGMLSDLFPRPPTHKSSPMSAASHDPSPSNRPHSRSKACPDPLLHERTPIVLCPEPALHFRSCTPSFPHGASAGHNAHIHAGGARGYPGHYNRATATGSPMPFKVKPSTASPNDMRRQSHETMHPSAHMHHPRFYRQQHDIVSRPHTSGANEHFQPGWYYANDGSRPMRPGPAMYSFSTAAAKVVGRDPAPDSRIRDSYRTDTLTPLAKPPSRFRKNGIIALANSRGVGKYYGGSGYGPRPLNRHMHSSGIRLPDAMRFRSSPPSSLSETADGGQTRKRTRDSENELVEILEDNVIKEETIDPKLKLEEGEEVIEVDEETRAAVRMSLFGRSSTGSSMRELSPNVMTSRKEARRAEFRKKRRPSYWDGDLEEIMRSPAARHVVSSPIKKDDVRSQQAEVEFEDEEIDGRTHRMDEEMEGVSKIVEGPTVLQEDVQMQD